MTPAADPTRDLRRFAWLSIAAAIATITLKAGAWLLTGSVGLLSDAAEVGGLQLPTEDLQHAAEKFSSQIDAQIADNPEISTAIAHMERQYDAYMESLRGSDSLTPGGKPLPSGDEIGAEFERFLAERSADDDPDADQERPADPGGDAQTH